MAVLYLFVLVPMLSFDLNSSSPVYMLCWLYFYRGIIFLFSLGRVEQANVFYSLWMYTLHSQCHPYSLSLIFFQFKLIFPEENQNYSSGKVSLCNDFNTFCKKILPVYILQLHNLFPYLHQTSWWKSIFQSAYTFQVFSFPFSLWFHKVSTCSNFFHY